MDFTVTKIRLGCALFALCAAIYALFWGTSYNPQKQFPKALSVSLFFATFLVGVAAIVFLFSGSLKFSPIKWIGLGSVALYIAVLLITKFAFQRVVTTELILIVVALALEVMATSALWTLEVLGAKRLVIAGVLIAVGAVLSIVCYTVYYKISARCGFIVGFVPLSLVALVMTTLAILSFGVAK